MSDEANAASGTNGRGYDRLGIPRPDGDYDYMTPGEFERLPLAERVKHLMGGRLRFFRKGQQISAREALRGG